jgi:hypothetical protein
MPTANLFHKMLLHIILYSILFFQTDLNLEICTTGSIASHAKRISMCGPRGGLAEGFYAFAHARFAAPRVKNIFGIGPAAGAFLSTCFG